MWVNFGLLVLSASLIGARLFYTWTNRGYFSSHMEEALQIWTGGLLWPGAIAGAGLVILILSITYRNPRGQRCSPGWIADQLYPLLPILSISIWMGSWLIGTAYGPQTPAGAWWGIPSLDESGIYSQRWPLQPIAAVSLLLLFWLIEMQVKPSHPAGMLSGSAFCVLLVHLILTSLMRSDPVPFWNGIRMDIWMAAFYLFCFLFIVFTARLVARLRKRLRPAQLPGTSMKH